MKHFSLSRGLGVFVVAAFTVCATSDSSGNPLATIDQHALDALAIEISNDDHFVVLKAEAKAAFQTAHGLPISDEAASSLDEAIDELAFSSIQKAVNTDAYHPKIYWVDAGPRNWFGLDVPGGRYSYDNPDCFFRTIPIDYSLDYVVRGYRHTPGPADVTFSLISDPNSQNTVAALAGTDLVIESDGSYTVTINSSSANGQANHIQSTLLAKQLLIRNNLGDWFAKPDNLTVEVINADAHSAKSKADIILAAGWDLQESIVDYGVGALGLKTMTNQVNTLADPSQSSSLGTLTTQASSFGHFDLSDTEALVATLTKGPADYFVVPLSNPWMITKDPGTRQISLNSAQAEPNANGTYTFVISPSDPGVYNWIDMAGLHEVTTMVRWQGLPTSNSSASDALSVVAQIVPLADLKTVLPDGTRFVTVEERKAQLAKRVEAYALRTAV
ncbi:uncharacterized protein PFLUO_LOCUS3417 [Penicillium psychrofluorescens]|uniref:uncharacterized protein n=1 Tax=Penicillium psychrofluorescens TaxID=3158075 RepID=UPI003CCCA3D7